MAGQGSKRRERKGILCFLCFLLFDQHVPWPGGFARETRNENPDSTGASGENGERKRILCFLGFLLFNPKVPRPVTSSSKQKIKSLSLSAPDIKSMPS
jgi:hypothetical protein